jgi:hypothetical protein
VYRANGKISIKFYAQYRFPGARSLPTIRIASPAGSARSRPADALLLHSSVLLENAKACVWADLAAVIQVTVALAQHDPLRFTFLAVHPYVQCPSAQLGAMVDSTTGMPLVVRPPVTGKPLIVSPYDVVSPVHVIDLSANFDHPDAATGTLCYINWFIFRSQWKYPVRHRDQMLGLRGHGVARKSPAAAAAAAVPGEPSPPK